MDPSTNVLRALKRACIYILALGAMISVRMPSKHCCRDRLEKMSSCLEKVPLASPSRPTASARMLQ